MAEARAPEFEPPMACVSRVMKASLPDNILLTKDARAAFVRAAGIFIFYLTHCSNDFCRESKRSTIFPQDVMAALRLDYLSTITYNKSILLYNLPVLYTTGNWVLKILSNH